jgi:hypothetical protein
MKQSRNAVSENPFYTNLKLMDKKATRHKLKNEIEDDYGMRDIRVHSFHNRYKRPNDIVPDEERLEEEIILESRADRIRQKKINKDISMEIMNNKLVKKEVDDYLEENPTENQFLDQDEDEYADLEQQKQNKTFQTRLTMKNIPMLISNKYEQGKLFDILNEADVLSGFNDVFPRILDKMKKKYSLITADMVIEFLFGKGIQRRTMTPPNSDSDNSDSSSENTKFTPRDEADQSDSDNDSLNNEESTLASSKSGNSKKTNMSSKKQPFPQWINPSDAFESENESDVSDELAEPVVEAKAGDPLEITDEFIKTVMTTPFTGDIDEVFKAYKPIRKFIMEEGEALNKTQAVMRFKQFMKDTYGIADMRKPETRERFRNIYQSEADFRIFTDRIYSFKSNPNT